jgi:poly(A) polymerase
VNPKIYVDSQHEIDHSLIDPDALFVITKLREAGYSAYLVGGSVRDVIAKVKPKDFDISTSALPEQVKQVFKRNCLLIGRRFRLAHIRFGKKVIEVSTFRAGENEGELILQDNEWGTPEEDAKRRDFTINGLFYDPTNHSVIDYVGGWEDIHKKTLRTIGNPVMRFKQDPVRMIRLLKFCARFGFKTDDETMQAMLKCREEIIKSAPARILEEFLRMLESGSAAPFIQLMHQHGFLETLFPALAHFLDGPHADKLYTYLKCADRIHNQYGIAFINRSILTACLLFPIYEQELQTQYLDKNLMPHFGEIVLLAHSLLKGFETSSFTHLTRRLSSTAAFIMATQYRLTPLTGKISYRNKLLHNKEFVLALKFLDIRTLINPKLAETCNNWKKAYRAQEHHGDRTPHPHSNAPYRRHHHHPGGRRERRHAGE